MQIDEYITNHYKKYLCQAKVDLIAKFKLLDESLFRRKPKKLKVRDLDLGQYEVQRLIYLPSLGEDTSTLEQKNTDTY